MTNPFLIGRNIYLRPLEREDAPLLVRWVNDPEVTRNLLIHRPMNLQIEQDFVAKMQQSEHDVVLGIALQKGDQLIGSVGLHQIDFKNRHVSFGIMIGEKDQWGQGHGTAATRLMTQYAFETLNLNRVWLHVFENNERGIRAYEKVGFRKEGLLRQHHYREGRYWDTFVMAILREQWKLFRDEQQSPE